MKKLTLIINNTIVCAIIIVGFLMMIMLNNHNFNEIVENDIENISKLSSSTIYGEIDNRLTQPIFVGQTMANDLFLKNWLLKESANQDVGEQQKLMQDYLNKYRVKYGYDSVFLVSSKSAIYYHYQGINKVVSPENAHDVWYYDFIQTGEPYKLDVDVDEANQNQLTVFVNCRVEAEDGSLLGVVGVGLKMNHLQALLKGYETEYNLKVKLINEEGVIQVDSDEKNIEVANFFDQEAMGKVKDEILKNYEGMKIFWYPEEDAQTCVTTQYIKNLDWYIVVQKDTLQIRELLTEQFNQDLILIALILLSVLCLSAFIIYRYNRLLVKKATSDDVTNLPNVKMFYEMYKRNRKKVNCEQGSFFMFDIDRFKSVNDEFGHLFGNAVLFQISAVAKELIGEDSLLSRFGGDEFIGVIYTSPEEANRRLKELLEKIEGEKFTEEAAHITSSIGVTRITAEDDVNQLIKEADFAMYRSKERGGNCISHYEKKQGEVGNE